MIITICLSPAFQRTMEFSKLTISKVNRSIAAHEGAGGKGINAARAAAREYDEVMALTILGGPRIQQFIGYCEADGFRIRYAKSPSHTRTCCTLLDLNEMTCTELVEESPEVTMETLDEFSSLFSDAIGNDGSDLLLFSGSIPKGVPARFIPSLVEEGTGKGSTIMLDMTGQLLLDSMKTGAGFIKINEQEFVSTFLPTDTAAGFDIIKAKESSRRIFEETGYKAIITRGAEDTWAFDGYEMLSIPNRKIKGLNTTGCGDTFAGAFLGALANGTSYIDSLDNAQVAAIRKATEDIH